MTITENQRRGKNSVELFASYVFLTLMRSVASQHFIQQLLHREQIAVQESHTGHFIPHVFQRALSLG